MIDELGILIPTPLFRDRQDAGRQLAERLTRYGTEAPLVLALPRGGVVVGYEVARRLGAPLDVFVARKLGAPGYPELGIGAVAPGVCLVDQEALETLRVSADELRRIAAAETAEVGRRLRQYRGDRPATEVRGRTVILVDDGLATGVTAQAAVRALRRQQPRDLILAVPVCAPQPAAALRREVDDLVCLASPPNFQAVGCWYEDFRQISDEEVINLLDAARREQDAGAAGEPLSAARAARAA